MTIYEVDHAPGFNGLLTVSRTCDLDLMGQFLEAHDVNVNAFPCPGHIELKDGSVTFELVVKDENGRDVFNEARNDVERTSVTVEQRAPWPLDGEEGKP